MKRFAFSIFHLAAFALLSIFASGCGITITTNPGATPPGATPVAVATTQPIAPASANQPMTLAITPQSVAAAIPAILHGYAAYKNPTPANIETAANAIANLANTAAPNSQLAQAAATAQQLAQLYAIGQAAYTQIQAATTQPSH